MSTSIMVSDSALRKFWRLLPHMEILHLDVTADDGASVRMLCFIIAFHPQARLLYIATRI